jgi:diacylglycerol kinase (ATP)
MTENQKHKMKENTLLESFDHAVRGVLFCVRNERNFRIHLIFAFGALLGSVFLHLSLVEFYVLLLVITMVLIAEMVNTALEKLVDLATPEYNRLAREIKNIGAACVLVAVVVSLFIGYLILGKHIPDRTEKAVQTIITSPWYLSVIALILTYGLIFFVKIRMRSKSLFRGGMPSGHAALSFGILTAIYFITASPMVTALVLPMSILVTQSRIKRGIHSWSEVFYGALLGIFMATLVFQVFRRFP